MHGGPQALAVVDTHRCNIMIEYTQELSMVGNARGPGRGADDAGNRRRWPMTAAYPSTRGPKGVPSPALRRGGPRGWLQTARRRWEAAARLAHAGRGGRQPSLGYPPAPAGEILYAIGDVHGRAYCLARAQTLIDRDAAGRTERATEIYLGDYIDRGPDSKSTLDLMAARAHARQVVALRGNHETAMESFLAGRLPFAVWRGLGGAETLLSYGFEPGLIRGEGPRREAFAERLPDVHRRFLAGLADYHRAGGYCFAHAGLRPGIALDRQRLADLTGVRDEFLDCDDDFGFVVVHGHTPVERVDFRSNRINLDTGAYVSNRLSVLRIDDAGATLVAPEAS